MNAKIMGIFVGWQDVDWTFSSSRLLSLSILILATLLSSPVFSTPFAYEDFDYPPESELISLDGGVGFLSPWNEISVPQGSTQFPHNNFGVAAGSLTFGSLRTSGNRMLATPQDDAIARISRRFRWPNGAKSHYVSFLLRPEGVLGEGWLNGFFGVTVEPVSGAGIKRPIFAGSGRSESVLGEPLGNSTIYVGGDDDGGAKARQRSNVPAIVGQTTFVVLRLEFNSGPEQITMYVNPDPGGPEPTLGTTTNFDMHSTSGPFHEVGLSSTGAFSVDEIRVGLTFDSVTPVPEPGSSTPALLILFAFASCLRPRRKTKQ